MIKNVFAKTLKKLNTNSDGRTDDQMVNTCNSIVNINCEGIVLPSDVDINLWHMNNARYCRELDFCRADYFTRARVSDLIFFKHGGAVSGHCIRYRLPLYLFAPFKVIFFL